MSGETTVNEEMELIYISLSFIVVAQTEYWLLMTKHLLSEFTGPSQLLLFIWKSGYTAQVKHSLSELTSPPNSFPVFI